MKRFMDRRLFACLFATLVSSALCLGASAQTAVPATAPASPPATATPPAAVPASPVPASPVPTKPTPEVPPQATPSGGSPAVAPSQTTPGGPAGAKELAPGKPQDNEVEPNGAPGVPGNATTEDVDVPARPIVFLKSQSSYDDAFKSVKASLETLKAAMTKAGLTPTGHPVTIFADSDDKGSKFEVAVPIAAIPTTKPDLGAGVAFGMSPAGKAIKFQHRGAYDDIDSTYDVITAYLDAKGLQVANSYIEEYLTDLTTADDPNLQVDVYVFIKK